MSEVDKLFRNSYAEVVESSDLVWFYHTKLFSLLLCVTLYRVVKVERKHRVILRTAGVHGFVEIVESLNENVFDWRRLQKICHVFERLAVFVCCLAVEHRHNRVVFSNGNDIAVAVEEVLALVAVMHRRFWIAENRVFAETSHVGLPYLVACNFTAEEFASGTHLRKLLLQHL